MHMAKTLQQGLVELAKAQYRPHHLLQASLEEGLERAGISPSLV